MKQMTAEERRQFLTAKPRTGKVASVRADGRPHLTPVWFVMDGDDVIFTVWKDTVKLANLQRDPRVSFCVDDDQPPYAYVIIEGTATVDPHAPDLVEWATRLATKYFGEELGKVYGKRNGVEGEHLVRIKPDKIIANTGIAD
jgi:PPOX class probable F420-dependent enzyme